MTSSAKPEYQAWDVVVVPFPFTDKEARGVRPAVIVSTEKLSLQADKFFLAMITNATHAPMYGDVAISDLKAAGLPLASVVRPAKLATLEEGAFHRRVGTLRRIDRQRISNHLREFIAFEEAPS